MPAWFLNLKMPVSLPNSLQNRQVYKVAREADCSIIKLCFESVPINIENHKFIFYL